MNFTAIDFETAHRYFPCEIGLTRVEDGKITASGSWLIRPACFPYMNPHHKAIHGISSTDVERAKTFEELWGELKPWVEDQLVVAHNAPFDMNVLRASLAYYDLAVPWIEYFCSVRLSRKIWKNLPSHSLGNLCEYHNIRFNHHRAGEDALACAKIVLKAFDIINTNDIYEGLKKTKVKIRRLKTE